MVLKNTVNNARRATETENASIQSIVNTNHTVSDQGKTVAKIHIDFLIEKLIPITIGIHAAEGVEPCTPELLQYC